MFSCTCPFFSLSIPTPYSTSPWGFTWTIITLDSNLVSLTPIFLYNSSIKSIRAVFINMNRINYNDHSLRFEWSPESLPLFISACSDSSLPHWPWTTFPLLWPQGRYPACFLFFIWASLGTCCSRFLKWSFSSSSHSQRRVILIPWVSA